MRTHDWSIALVGREADNSRWLRIVKFVNGCAHGAGQPPVFHEPTDIQHDVVDGRRVCVVHHERATIAIHQEGRAEFYCSSEDKELQRWFEAGKAHLMGFVLSKPMGGA